MREMVEDSSLQTEIRRSLAVWAETMGVKNTGAFASEVEITSIMLQPVFFANLVNLYESRAAHVRYLPVEQGVSLDYRIVNSLDAVDVWDLSIPGPDKMKASKREYAVPRSEGIIACPDCSTQGLIENSECPLCSGTGTILCSFCKGAGADTCNTCLGTELRPCAKCGGKKLRACLNCKTTGRSQGGACRICHGKGKVECEVCEGIGNVPCNICSGLRVSSCQVCEGVGRIICDHISNTATGRATGCTTCYGTGLLKEFFVVEQAFDPVVRSCTSVDEDLAGYKGFYESLQNGELALPKLVGFRKLRAERLPLNMMDDISLADWYRKELETLNLGTDAIRLEKERGSDVRHCMQSIDVRYIEVCDVSFIYMGSEYQTLVRLDTHEVYLWGRGTGDNTAASEQGEALRRSEAMAASIAAEEFDPRHKKHKKSRREKRGLFARKVKKDKKARKQEKERDYYEERYMQAYDSDPDQQEILHESHFQAGLKDDELLTQDSTLPWDEWTWDGGIFSARIVGAVIVASVLIYFLRGSDVWLFTKLYQQVAWPKGLVYPSVISLVAVLWVMLTQLVARRGRGQARSSFLLAFALQNMWNACMGVIIYFIARAGIFFGIMWPISLVLKHFS